MTDILQRLVTGNLTADERRGVSEFNKQWDTDDPEPLEPLAVSFRLKDEEKRVVYQDVKSRIEAGASPDEIAEAVVGCIDQQLMEKEHQAYPAAYNSEKEFESKKPGQPARKGAFRRV